jgi:hypothetical protein
VSNIELPIGPRNGENVGYRFELKTVDGDEPAASRRAKATEDRRCRDRPWQRALAGRVGDSGERAAEFVDDAECGVLEAEAI